MVLAKRCVPLTVTAVLALGLFSACRPAPPVGRAADPESRESTKQGPDADLLRQVDALRDQVKKNPGNHEVKLGLGQLYYNAERFLDATLVLREALDEDPKDDKTRQMLANCFFYVGNPDAAIELHEDVLKRKPDDPDSLFLLGAILVESRPTDQDALKRAEKVWSHFLEVQPNHRRKAELQGQLDRVRAALRGEISLAAPPQDRGQPQQEQGDDEEEAPPQVAAPPAGMPSAGPAPEQGPSRVSQLPKNATPVDKKRAEALDALDGKRFAEAQTAAEVVLMQLPDDPEMSVVQARVLVQTGKLDEAIKTFSGVIKKHPKYSPAWHYLGMAYMFGNEAARAAQTWREVQKFDPQYFSQNRLEQRAQMADRMGAMRGGQ